MLRADMFDVDVLLSNLGIQECDAADMQRI